MPLKLFEEFDPRRERRLEIMDPAGQIVNPAWKPDVSDAQALEAYRKMLFVRTVDLMAVSYQRQGRMYTYPPNLGQEAIGVTVGLHIRPDDWLVPAYRELGAWLAKGATLWDVFLYFGGHEDGCRLPGAEHMLPWAVPIASQLLHAAGIGYAIRYQGRDQVVFTFVGEGGTSQGDFHEALNFAGVWKAPVVFVCQNNQYAISCPVARQTAAPSIAIKALAYGIAGLQVDGNDFFALHAAVEAATAHARGGRGPVLIEAVTYRRGAHTTSDDPTKYRTAEEEAEWAEKDPLRRLQAYLAARGLWQPGDDETWAAEFKKEIDAQFVRQEGHPYPLEDVFRHLYTEMPEHLRQQLVRYQKFENRQEGRS